MAVPTEEKYMAPLNSEESSNRLQRLKKLVRRTQFGAKRIPKKFRFFLQRSYPMYEDDLEESSTYKKEK